MIASSSSVGGGTSDVISAMNACVSGIHLRNVFLLFDLALIRQVLRLLPLGNWGPV